MGEEHEAWKEVIELLQRENKLKVCHSWRK